MFHPPVGRFDGIIGGPPCQFASRLRHFVESNGLEVAENLIPEFERCVAEAAPDWFLMENVPQAPLPAVPGYQIDAHLFRDFWCGGETTRQRRFSFGTVDGRKLSIQFAALHRIDPQPTVTASGGTPPDWIPTERHKATRKGKAATGFKSTRYLGKAIQDQGLPADFLSDAPFTVAGKIKAIGNGVPLAMGRAVAQAVRNAIMADAAPKRRTVEAPAQQEVA